ncbi:MAG: hypothetical protein ABSD53_14885 [Terriglobales bacterium]|jgi:hypothetical protein
MGKGRDKEKRKRKKQGQRTREELDPVKEREMEREERADAERRAKLSRKALGARAGSDPPPILGEPDAPVRAPLRPKPHPRSGAIALGEPEPEDAIVTVNQKSILK